MSKIIKNIIFPIEFNHFTGGMLHSVMDLAEELTLNYNVYILANKDAEVFNRGSNLNYLTLEKPFCVSIHSPWRTLITYFEIRKLLCDFNENDTLIFTNNVGSELLLSGFGFFSIKFDRVFVSRGGDYKGKTGYILKIGFRSAKAFIATSSYQSKVLQDIGILKDKIKVIHNGINIQVDIDSYQFSRSGKIHLSIVGYISENKNQILAVEILKILLEKGYDVVLNIFGVAFSKTDKEYEKKLLSKINELNCADNVKFLGFKTNINEIYQNTDILLSCSLSEGFGRVVAESMAFGVPCIGLKESGGLCDIITNDVDGFLTNTDKFEISKIIEVLIENEEIRNCISQNALIKYKTKFTKDIMCDKYDKFIKELF